MRETETGQKLKHLGDSGTKLNYVFLLHRAMSGTLESMSYYFYQASDLFKGCLLICPSILLSDKLACQPTYLNSSKVLEKDMKMTRCTYTLTLSQDYSHYAYSTLVE